MTQPPQNYDSLHFHDYLDGGPQTLAAVDWAALRGECSVRFTTRYTKTVPSSMGSSEIPFQHQEQYAGLLNSYAQVCESLLGKTAVALEFPGGFLRSTVRLQLEDGHSLIAVRRFDATRSRFESLVLQRLWQQGAPVPTPYAYNGLVLLQEDMPGQRLSDALRTASAAEYQHYMHAALASLHRSQQAAKQANLADAVPVLGSQHNWLVALIDRTALLANFFGLPQPPVPVKDYYNLLFLVEPHFIKWDARPGNALLSDNNEVRWFDWEHCCARSPCDDIVWLLCDDACPDFPAEEEALIEHWLGYFNHGFSPTTANNYLRVFGIHHMCVRLTRMLDEKGSASWSDYEHHTRSQPGELLNNAQRLCYRAARWSTHSSTTMMLENWFLALADKLSQSS